MCSAFSFFDMSNNINILLRDVHQAVEQMYHQRDDHFSHILRGIQEKYGDFLEDDDFKTNQNAHVINTEIKLVKKPISKVLKSDESNSCTQSSENTSRSKNSTATYETARSDTLYMDATENRKAESKTLRKNSNAPKLSNDADVTFREQPVRDFKINIPAVPSALPLPTHSTCEDKNSNRTATQKNGKTKNDPIERFQPRVLRSNRDALRERNINANSKSKRVELPKKKVEINSAATNKRKRDEIKHKITPKKIPKYRPLVKMENERGEKGKLLFPNPKVEPVDASKAQKKREIWEVKQNQTRSQFQVKREIVEYNIDHIVGDASSDDEYAPKNPVPEWARKEAREYPLKCQAWLNKEKTVYRWFYNEKLKYPKMAELFPSCCIRARTSSAVWNREVS